MDVDCNFESDTTYCSLYENFQTSFKNSKLNHSPHHSKSLEEINNDITLHSEGKILLGRIQTLHYMKQISQMTLTNKRTQNFARKIQSTLFKIYKLAKKFESLHLSKNNSMADPIENCDLTEDFHINKIDTDNQKILLCQQNSKSDNSFPLDILTNDNFISMDSQKFSKVDILQNNSVMKFVGNANGNKTFSTNIDTFNDYILNNATSPKPSIPSDENEICIENSSKITNIPCENNRYYMKKNITNSDFISTKTDNVITRDLVYNKNNDSLEFSTNNDVSVDGIFESNKKAIINDSFYENSNLSSIKIDEDTKDILKNATNVFAIQKTQKTNEDHSDSNMSLNENIAAVSNSASLEHYSANNDNKLTVNSLLSETIRIKKYYLQNRTKDFVSSEGFDNISSETQRFSFGQNPNERLISKKISELGEDKISWHDIDKILHQEEDMKRNADFTLNKLFKNLSFEQARKREKEYKEKIERECIHNFDPVDQKKLNWRNLFIKNETKLEAISKEFISFIKDEETDSLCTENEHYCEEIEWKKLLE